MVDVQATRKGLRKQALSCESMTLEETTKWVSALELDGAVDGDPALHRIVENYLEGVTTPDEAVNVAIIRLSELLGCP